MVPRQMKSRLSYLVATARYWRSRQKARSTTLRCLYSKQPRRRQAAAFAATPQPVLHLVRGLGDRGPDPPPAQMRADRRAGAGLVAQHPPGPGPGPPPGPPRDPQPAHQRGEGQRVMPLPGAGHPGQRPATGVRQQVDLAGQTAARPAQRLPVLVIRCRPLHAPGRSARPAPAAPGQYPPAGHGGLLPHAGAPAPPWHRPPPSTPGRWPRRTRPSAGPGSSPRSRLRTSGDAGYRRSSSSRTALAGPATGLPSGSGGRSR
jgi:hypothetical protein